MRSLVPRLSSVFRYEASKSMVGPHVQSMNETSSYMWWSSKARDFLCPYSLAAPFLAATVVL